MAVMELWRRRDLEGAVKTEYIDGNFFTQDSVGNLVGVKCYKDGAEAILSGSVTGYCILPSGETVSVAGTRSGNQASILIPQSALAYPGPLGVVIKLVDGNTITTLISVIVVVYRSKTDTVITPSSQIITDWSNQIAAALQDVEDASAAQDVKINDLKSAFGKLEINGHAGVKYTGVKFAGSNTTVAGTDGSIAVYSIEPDDCVKVVLKRSSTSGNIDRDGIALSNNPVPTIGETIRRYGSTHAMTEDTTIEFKNEEGYKYLYVYYYSANTGREPNEYVTVTTVNDAVEVLNANELPFTHYYGVRLSTTDTVEDYSSESGSINVYKIEENQILRVTVTNDGDNHCDRLGIGFSNSPTPVAGATVVRPDGATEAVDEDETVSKVVCNTNGFKYMYVYFSQANLRLQKIDGIVVEKIGFGQEVIPAGYEKVVTTWSQGSRTDPTETTRIISALIDVNPIGRKWEIIVPNGYAINVFVYDCYGAHKATLYDTLQTGTVIISDSDKFIRGKYQIMLAKANNGNILPTAGQVLGIYRSTTDNQYGTGKYVGKKVSLMGDSITTYGSIDDASETGNDKWSPTGNAYTYPGNRIRYPQTSLAVVEPDHTYWMKAIKNLGMVLGINDSIAGSRVSGSGIPSDPSDGHYPASWYMALQKRIDRLDDNGTPDIIIVNGGTNDANNSVEIGTLDDYPAVSPTMDMSSLPTDTFMKAYMTMLLRMMKAYPSARIICLLPNYATYTIDHIDEYCEAIKEVCDLLGVPWIDIRASGITPINKATYINDGTHPNYRGMQLIGDRLTEALLYEV